jgi:transcriptional regulator with XRE-family HTH domain
MKVTEDPRVARLAVLFLHLLHGGTQQQLADGAGVSRSAISRCESGTRAVTPETLAKLAAAAEVLPHELASILAVIRAVVARRTTGELQAPQARPESWPEALQGLPTALADLYAERLRARSAPGPPAPPTGPAPEDRERAPALWERLAPCSHETRRALVEEVAKFQVWELADFLCSHSREATDGEAVELAELAVLVAERTQGEERWKAALEGHAWATLGRARQRAADPAGAEEALALARELQRRGAGAGHGLLDSPPPNPS